MLKDANHSMADLGLEHRGPDSKANPTLVSYAFSCSIVDVSRGCVAYTNVITHNAHVCRLVHCFYE